MAGHSKWANIQHRKGRQDAVRSKLFSKLAKEITVAAKMGGPDPASNARLRAAIAAAKAQSMPKDNIDRATKRATAADVENYEEVQYEGFGPGGVSVIVEALTDNRNRTASEVRAKFSKNGGNLGATGSVSHAFDRVGMVKYPAKVGSAEKVFEAALEAGADDCQSDEESNEITCAVEDFATVRDALDNIENVPGATGLINYKNSPIGRGIPKKDYAMVKFDTEKKLFVVEGVGFPEKFPAVK